MTKKSISMADEIAAEDRAAPLKDPYWVDALAQGIEVLRVFNGEPSGLTLSEVAKRLGWGRTKPFRFLYTLEKMGYLARDESGRAFRLTSLCMQLGFAYLHSIPLVELAQPLLDRLRADVGASVHLAVLERGELVYIAQARVQIPTVINLHVGSRLPAYATSIGRVLLAYMPEPVVLEMLGNEPLVAWTRKSTVDARQLVQILQGVRQQGHALNDGEFQEGVRSVAVPVFDASGCVVAGMNATATSYVFSEEKIYGQVLPALRNAAEELSRALGYRPRSQSAASDLARIGS